MDYHIADLVDEKAVIYRNFESFIQSCSLKDFLHVFKFPFLIGNDLFAGEMAEGSGEDTVQFAENQEGETPRGAAYVSKRLFYLSVDAKNAKSTQLFHIGRTVQSNITIVDYTISKNHAFIIFENGEYCLKDQGATNGTSINGVKVENKENHPLQMLDRIGFGRMEFILAEPIHLFLRMRTSYRMQRSLEDELPEMLRFTAARVLAKIAQQHNIDSTNKNRRVLLAELLEKLSPEQILLGLY